MKKDSRIQISRGSYIADSRDEAIIHLNEKEFLVGELAMVKYYKNPDLRTNIAVCTAIGVENGKGYNAYRLIEMGGNVMIRFVGDYLPDVSQLVHGETYLWHDTEKDIWQFVEKNPENPERIFSDIVGGPFIFEDIDSGYRWFYKDGSCKREDDFFTKDQFNIIIQDILSIAPKLTVSSNNGYIFKTGEYADLDLSFLVETKDGKNITSNCSYYINDYQVNLDENGHYVFANIFHDDEIPIKVLYPVTGGEIMGTLETKVTVKFGYDFYYGRIPGKGWGITKDNVMSLENKIVNYKHSWEWDGFELREQSIAIAYPEKYGYLSHIFDDNGLDYIHTYQAYAPTGLTIDGERYLVYVKKDVVSTTDFLQRWEFQSSESLDVEEGNLLKIVDAWKLKGTPGGLVVLDNNGKLDPSMYSIEATSTFPIIKEMVSSFPTGDMTKGDIYYNTTTKELFTSISVDSGVISSPEIGQIYRYGDGFYSWSIDADDLVKIGGLEVEEITDITQLWQT